MADQYPWDQLEEESDSHYRWFLVYAEIPFRARTLDEAAKIIAKSEKKWGAKWSAVKDGTPSEIQRLYTRFHWVDRASARDRSEMSVELRRQEDFDEALSCDDLVERVQSLRKFEWRLGVQFLRVVEMGLQRIIANPDEVKASHLRPLAEIAREMMAHSVGGGKSLEEVAAEVREMIDKDPDLAEMSEEDKAGFARRTAAASLGVVLPFAKAVNQA